MFRLLDIEYCYVLKIALFQDQLRVENNSIQAMGLSSSHEAESFYFQSCTS